MEINPQKNFERLAIEIEDHAAIKTEDNTFATTVLTAYIQHSESESKHKTIDCKEECLQGVYKGNLDIINNLQQKSHCKVNLSETDSNGKKWSWEIK